MSNKVVIFPETKQAEAEAYKAAVNVHYEATYEPSGTWAYIEKDAYDQWVVPYYGAPWQFDQDPFVEPEHLVPLRVDGVLHDNAVWPPVELL